MQNALTYGDMLKLMGMMTGFFSALTFFWMRHLKNEMRSDRRASKEDMRQMFRDMHAGFEEKYLLKLSNLCAQVNKLEEWYLAHYKTYHSKSGV